MSETLAATAPAQELRGSSGFLILVGILLIVLGVLAMGAPLIAGVSVALLVGVLMLFSGATEVVCAFRARSWGWGILSLLLGALSILCGLLVVAHPLLGLTFLTLLLAAYFVVEGIFEILHAFELRPLQGWGWRLVSGVVAVVLGAMIWSQWPISGVWAVGLLVGINIVLTGASLLGLGVAARGAAPKV